MSEHLQGVLDHKKLVGKYVQTVVDILFRRVVDLGDIIPYLRETDTHLTIVDMIDVACVIKRDGQCRFQSDVQLGGILRNTVEGFFADHEETSASRLTGYVIQDLFERAVIHDYSKFSPEEFDDFERVTPRLKTLTYGSEEYRASLREIKPAIQHHYQVNSHHPEHYPDGINGMNLLDVIEMVCDWIAATERVKDGDIYKGLEINKERFHIDDQLYGIIKNTVDVLTMR